MSDRINIACRTCMCTIQTYISILEHYECNKLLAEMLNECTTIKVDPFDDLPKYMCNNCMEKLISSWNFKSMALNADKKFRNNSNYKRFPATTFEIESVGIEMYEDAISIKEEEITVKVEESDPLIENNEICDDKSNELRPHLLVTERVECDLMGTKDNDFSSKDPIVATEATEVILESELERADEYNVENDFPIPKDDRKLTKEERNKIPVLCKLCNRSFPWKYYKVHRRQHIGDTPHKCDICGKAFVLQHQLKTHQVRHKDERRYPCDICKKSFKRKSELRNHKVIHIDTRPHKCETCGLTFKHLIGLRAHEARHKKENKYICEICGKLFLDPSTFSSHRLYLHTNSKKHSCPTCGKMFNTLSRMKEHENQKHLDHRPYVCNHCGKRFKGNDTLKKHILIHTGEKPHSCNICGKQFRQLSCLPRHMRTHTGETPFCCEKCPAKFKYSHLLKNHAKIHNS